MADFKSAIAVGLQAAIDAERRRNEVRSVFIELDKQVHEATNGEIRIAIEVWDPAGVNSLLKLVDRSKFIPDRAIVAIGKTGKQKEMLAKWEQSKDGYPCKIEIGADVYSCEDRVGLEQCLRSLLEDPTVGEKLHRLMKND